MDRLIDDIISFLETEGFECSRQDIQGFDIISVLSAGGKYRRTILPLEISCTSLEDSQVQSLETYRFIRSISSCEGQVLIITQDRWISQREMMEKRLLAHLEVFNQAYARNCEVRRIEKTEAKGFLEANHSYGYAACRYHYGLFLKRHTGHIARKDSKHIGELIAVATFSNARKWIKGGMEIRSYEWTRYASLADMRVSGGMGKMLKEFINDVHPDDIMSYADLEWSEGDVYRQLGFAEEMMKGAVGFEVDRKNWKRKALNKASSKEGSLYFTNFGSRKFRLKLTEYR